MRRLLRRILARISRRTPPFRGKMRGMRALDRWLAPRTRDGIVSTGGVTFQLAGFDLIEFSILYSGAYGSDVQHAISEAMPGAGAVYWDIGANLGSVVLPLMKRFPSLRAVAFEPSPHALNRLARNASLNPDLCERLTIMGIALADRNGPCQFFPSKEPYNSGLGGLAESENRSVESVTVWSARGDDLIAAGSIPTPSIIKIDVEGFELEVLRGLQDTLKNAHSLAILFEHSPYRLRERKMDLRCVPDYLEGLGFQLRAVDPDGTVRPLQERDLADEANLLASRWSA